MTRTPALAARYEFRTFQQPAAERAWLAGMIDKVGTGESVGSASPDSRWVTVAFTWNASEGLRPNSIKSYADAMPLFLQFAAEANGKKLTQLGLDDLHADAGSHFWPAWKSADIMRRSPVTSD